MKKLNDMTVEELKDACREHGVPTWHKNKNELIMGLAKTCELNGIPVEYDPVEVEETVNEDSNENVATDEEAPKEKKKRTKYIGTIPEDWAKKKVSAWKKHYREFFADGGETEEEVAAEMEIWSDEYDEEAAKPKQRKPISTDKRKKYEFNGKSQHICAWARELGMNANTLYNRIEKQGWSVEKAFTTPSGRRVKDDVDAEPAEVENE